MKKLLLTLLTIAAFCSTITAQEKVDEYHNTYFDKTYKIEASFDSNHELALFVEVAGESESDNVCFNIVGNDIKKFTDALAAAKTKYNEWVGVAKANNVTKMTKEMDITFPRVTICWYGSKWWFDFSHRLSPVFMITSSGDYVFLLSGEATASSNEYIDQDYYLALSTAEDFDVLISKMDPQTITEKLNNKQKVEDLFQ